MAGRDMTYCNCCCKNTECERNMVNINAPGYYSFADLSKTDVCAGKGERE